MDEKKINLSISEGKAFFSHEASINFTPTQFVMDYRSITPRIDPRSNDAPTISIEHNVVIVDPYHAKKIHELLGKMLDKFEKDFGKIEKTKAMKIMEKRRQDKKEHSTKTTPNYFG